MSSQLEADNHVHIPRWIPLWGGWVLSVVAVYFSFRQTEADNVQIASAAAEAATKGAQALIDETRKVQEELRARLVEVDAVRQDVDDLKVAFRAIDSTLQRLLGSEPKAKGER